MLQAIQRLCAVRSSSFTSFHRVVHWAKAAQGPEEGLTWLPMLSPCVGSLAAGTAHAAAGGSNASRAGKGEGQGRMRKRLTSSE